MKVGEKLCNFIAFYCSQGQSPNKFETFVKTFEINLGTVLGNNPFWTVVLGDFNVKQTCGVEVTKRQTKIPQFDNIACQFLLH